MASARPAVSAIVTTFNEEEHIGPCLDSLLWCDELLVVDSFSTDRTPEIVAGYPQAAFVQREYFGAAAQKNWAMGQVRHEWILIFDADERCTPKLRAEIEELLAHDPEHDAYTIHRQVYFLGKRIKYSGWQRDRVVRLIRRGTAHYPNRRVHADMMTRGPAPVLDSSMIHYMADSFDEYVRRIMKYSNWGAGQGWREERRAGAAEVFGRSVWRFLRTYIFQRGFLDGMHGLVFCMLQAYGTYLKWATLWGWRINAARGREPELPPFEDSEEVWSVPEEPVSEEPVPEEPSGDQAVAASRE